MQRTGEFRPSEQVPLPEYILPSPIPEISSSGYPGLRFPAVHPTNSRVRPFYDLTRDFNHDLQMANWTLGGLQEFDGDERIWVLIAHDDTHDHAISLFPESLNDWNSLRWKEELKWNFLRTFIQGA